MAFRAHLESAEAYGYAVGGGVRMLRELVANPDLEISWS